MGNAMIVNISENILTAQLKKKGHRPFNLEFKLGSEHSFVDGFYLPTSSGKFDIHNDRYIKTINYASRILSEIVEDDIELFLKKLAKRMSIKKFQSNTNGGLHDDNLEAFSPQKIEEMVSDIKSRGFSTRRK